MLGAQGEGPGEETPEPSRRTRGNASAGGQRVVVGYACPAAPWRSGGVDGRYGWCGGCRGKLVFCRGCVSVRARCAPCARRRRVEQHRQANRKWSRTPQGQASGRRRQAAFRARRRGRVTDTISTEAVPPPTPPPSPPSPMGGPVRGQESRAHVPREMPEAPCVLRCARCHRVLSCYVLPSESFAVRRRHRRVPRQPRAPA
jgi:hypothetical protein